MHASRSRRRLAHSILSIANPSPSSVGDSDAAPWHSSAPPEDGPPKHHPVYYFKDGNITLLADNYLFKIHRYFLERESAFFLTMLSLPQGEDGEEGLSDEKPLPLGSAMHITYQKVEGLCNFLYYGMHDSGTPPVDEWSALLSIASKLDCTDIRRRAIAELDGAQRRMDAFERVIFANKHHVKIWLASAYEALCTREQPLSFGEGSALGMELAMAFAEARERIRAAAGSESSRPESRERIRAGSESRRSSTMESMLARSREHTRPRLLIPYPISSPHGPRQPPQAYDSALVSRIVKEVFRI